MSTALATSGRGDVLALLRHFLAVYPGRSITIVALLAVAGLAEGVSVLVLLPLVELSMGGDASRLGMVGQWLGAALAAFGLKPSMGPVLLLMVLGIVVKAAVTLVAMKEVGYAVGAVMTDLRRRLIRAVMNARWSYFVTQPLGHFANAIGAETIRAGSSYQQVTRFAASLIQAAVYGIATIIVSWRLAALAILAGLAGILLFRRLVSAAQDAGGAQTELLRSLSSRITDTLQGIKAIKAMAAESRALPMLDHEIRELDDAQRRQVWSAEVLRVAQEPMLVVFLSLGIYAAITFGGETLPTLMVAAVLFYRLFNRFQAAQEIYQQIAVSESAYWSVQQLGNDAERYAESTQGAAVVATGPARITFQGVAYSYGEQPVLRSVSLTVEPGQLVVISGISGGGKTTLLDLVTGLLAPTSGRIEIDGRDLTTLDVKAWRQRIGYVPQDPLLLHDSVLRNVTLGDERLTRGDVERALQAAGIADVVTALPDGIDTLIGERGGRFSGGQRQRLSLARALVRSPSLLLLDEITAALDKDTEREVCATLRRLAGRMTIIAVSHQAEMARIADRSLRLEGGVLQTSSKSTRQATGN